MQQGPTKETSTMLPAHAPSSSFATATKTTATGAEPVATATMGTASIPTIATAPASERTDAVMARNIGAACVRPTEPQARRDTQAADAERQESCTPLLQDGDPCRPKSYLTCLNRIMEEDSLSIASRMGSEDESSSRSPHDSRNTSAPAPCRRKCNQHEERCTCRLRRSASSLCMDASRHKHIHHGSHTHTPGEKLLAGTELGAQHGDEPTPRSSTQQEAQFRVQLMRARRQSCGRNSIASAGAGRSTCSTASTNRQAPQSAVSCALTRQTRSFCGSFYDAERDPDSDERDPDSDEADSGPAEKRGRKSAVRRESGDAPQARGHRTSSTSPHGLPTVNEADGECRDVNAPAEQPYHPRWLASVPPGSSGQLVPGTSTKVKRNAMQGITHAHRRDGQESVGPSDSTNGRSRAVEKHQRRGSSTSLDWCIDDTEEEKQGENEPNGYKKEDEHRPRQG